MIKSTRREPDESVDRGQSSDSPRNPCNFGSYRLKVEMHLNTRSKTIGRESFCARHNHRDFFTISWNIWAICLRDERPDGMSHCSIHSFLLLFFLPAAGYTRLYYPISLSQQQQESRIFPT